MADTYSRTMSTPTDSDAAIFQTGQDLLNAESLPHPLRLIGVILSGIRESNTFG